VRNRWWVLGFLAVLAIVIAVYWIEFYLPLIGRP
jgi:hypothetical protein